MVSKGDKFLLDYKKELFLREVEKASANLGVITPRVKFWSHYENHFDEGERAHMHFNENLICIAEPELEIMNEEDIRETATHEVSHTHHHGHGWEFQKTNDNLGLSSWQPPGGTIGAIPEGYVRPKAKKHRIIKDKCNRCNKKIKTKECKYCGGYFCEEHLNPIEAGFNKFRKFVGNDKEKTHPCMGYNNYLIEEEARKEKEYEEALGRLCKKDKTPTKNISKNYESNAIEDEEKQQRIMDYGSEFNKEDKDFINFLKWMGILMGVVILFLVVRKIFF